MTDTDTTTLAQDTPPKVHVMIDVETLATQSPVPVLLSLGAVKFTGTEITDRFHVRIDAVDCERYGLEIEADTVLWWMDDTRQQARTQLHEMPAADLFSALDGFAMWVNLTPEPERGSAWSCGSNFDLTKLKAIYQKVGAGANVLEWPFPYNREECYRTLKNRFRDVPFQRLGVHHGALDDAESQAQHAIAMVAAGKITL